MANPSEFNPANLKPSWVKGSNLKPSVTRDSYSGGTPSAASDLKPPLTNADGTLKASLRVGGQLKPSLLFDGQSSPTYPTELLELATFITATPALEGSIANESPTGTARAGQPHRCYDFDGSSDHIQVGSAKLTSASSGWASAWIYPDVNNATQHIVSQRDESTGSHAWIPIRLHSTGVVSIYCNGSTFNLILGSTVLPTGQWHHVVCQSNGSNYEIFVNGSRETLTVSSGSDDGEWANNATDADNFSVGASIGASAVAQTFFNGKVFDLRVGEGAALTPDQVFSLFSKGPEANIATVLYLKCDDTHPTTAYDSSGNENNGTKTSITDSTFHYQGADVPDSFQNDVGYSAYPYFDGTYNLRSPTNELQNALNGAEEIELSCAFSIDESNASDRRLIDLRVDGSAGGFVVFWDVSAGDIVFQARSRSADAIQSHSVTSAVQDGRLHTLSCKVNFAAETMTITIDGTENAASGKTFGSDTFVLGSPGFDDALLSDVTGASDWLGVVQSLSVAGDSVAAIAFDSNMVETTNLAFSVTGTKEAILVPRDESDTTNDVLGAALVYSGAAKIPIQATKAMCGTFDGVDDYIALPSDPFSGLSEFTITGWANVTGTASGGVIGAWNSDTDMSVLVFTGGPSDDKLHFRVRCGSTTTTVVSGSPVEGVGWFHFSCVYNGATIKIFINGVEDATPVALTGVVATPSSALPMIGRYSTGANLLGQLAGIRVYNSALTDSEVLSTHTTQADPSPDNLVSHYPFSEGAGTTVHDVSSNGNDGTATSITESTFWGSSQDVFHWNLAKGFSRYTHASSDPIRVPFLADGSQISFTPPTGYSLDEHCPADSYHNGAESHLDFTGGVARQINSRTKANMLSVPEDFTDAAWTKANTTATANAIAAPDGQTTADKLGASATATSSKAVYQSVSLVAGRKYTYSVYAKADELQFVQLSLSAGFTIPQYVNFNLSTGASQTGFGGAGSIESVGKGWYRISIKGVAATTTTGNILISLVDAIDASVTEAFASSTGDGVYLWGAKQETDEISPYHPVGFDASLDEDWEFNDAQSNPRFHRTINKDSSAYRADQFLAYPRPLLGSDLTLAQTYVTTLEL